MNNNAIIVAVSLIAAASIFLITYTDEAFGAFKTQRLNSFYLINQTTRQPLFTVVGQFMNNGTQTEKEVDISLTAFDKNDDIVGVAYLYNYDVKPNDLIPFRFRVPASLFEDQNFSAITRYTVIAE